MIKKKLVILLLIFCCATMFAFAQSKEQPEIINAITVESFDTTTADWTISASQYVDNQVFGSRVVEAWPNQLFGYTPAETRRALGIRAGFERRGNNYIEIIAPNGAVDLPGKVKEIEVWVWNSKRAYYVTAQIQDSRGVFYTLEMGDIDHLGWRKLSARIPNYIFQPEKLHAEQTGIRLLKFIVWTDPRERVDDFQIYFDEVRVLSDIYQRRIDGEQLVDPEFIERVWG